MSKLVIVGATALSLTLAVASPAFAAGFRSGGFHDARATSVVPSDASYCAQRWAYYDPASGKAMNDDGQWRACPRR